MSDGKATYAGLAALLALTCAVCQCTKEKPVPNQPLPAVTARPTPPDVRPAPRSEGPPPQRPADNVISLSPSPSLNPNTPPPTAYTRETDLFTAFPQARVMAEDFKIGVLQDGIASSRDFLGGLACVRKFLDSIMKKNVDYALVHPDVQAEIKAVVTYPLAQGYAPQTYRIGKIVFERDDELRANIRLYKDEGVTEGEIYLKKDEDEWKISDLQAGFTLLGRPYRKANEPFVPGSYSFLLGE